MTEIIPAIDIIGGRCVRLSQGDYSRSRIYDGDPVEWACRYADCGVRRLHLVDLEGAKASAPVNLATLEKLASMGGLSLEWGGGIKDRESLEAVLNAGAGWAIVGSVAASRPEMVGEWIGQYGRRIILGVDVRGSKVAVNGWLDDSGKEMDELLGRFVACGLGRAIVTDISRDGMLQGPAFPMYAALRKKYPGLEIVASGGVCDAGDLLEASNLGLDGIIVGKALYENKISLKELAEICLRNE